MVSRIFFRLLGCAALAAVPNGFLAAQESGPGETEASSTDIVVQGYTEKQVREFLWRAIETEERMVARRNDPICIGIDNAPAALADPVKARIEANLAEFAIPFGKLGCEVNTVIAFRRDAHAFVNWIDKQDTQSVFASLYLPQKRRLIKPVRAAYNWHYIPVKAAQLRGINQDASGQQPGQTEVQGIGFGIGGRIPLGRRPAEITASFAVVDTNAIDGLTIEQVGDWLTMQMLVDFRPDGINTVPADSILSLFTAKRGNPDAPPSLSRLDRTILSQIYGQRQNFLAGAVRAGVARTAVAELKAQGHLRAENE